MNRCVVLGCKHRSNNPKGDYVCRWHWRNANGDLTKTIKRFEKEGGNNKWLDKLWDKFLLDAILREAGLGRMTIDENNHPEKYVPPLTQL